MKKFAAIEGARGWLAWVVVLSHVALISNIYAKGFGHSFIMAGRSAVLIFVIISGFVITHLIKERPEPYIMYIIRRFMRIAPLFLVTCIVGYVTSDLLARVLTGAAWAINPFFTTERLAMFTGIANSDHDYFWQHVITHMIMLHGTIGDNLLPYSQQAFNPPAWSISLEWQFYLIAPFAIFLAGQRSAAIYIVLAIAALEIAYSFGLLGKFSNPSVLPGAAGYFALGIASRLACPQIFGFIRDPEPFAAVVIMLLPLGWDSAPLLIWVLIMIGIALDRSALAGASFAKWYRMALESPGILYLGSRSYSVYLCHLPVLSACLWVWLARFPAASSGATFVALSATAVPLTLLVSEFLHRGVERPGIAMGSWLVQRLATPRLVAHGEPLKRIKSKGR